MWRALVIDPVPRRHLESLSAALIAAGAAGLQEEGAGGVNPPPRQPWDTAPEPPPPDPCRVRAWFESPAEGLTVPLPAGAIPVWEDVVEEDWETSWQASFPILYISDRLVVAPPWEDVPGALVIEPGQGFGTGQHETTRQALRALDQLAGPDLGEGFANGRALDVGCGSGILALAAARLGWRAEGIDIDPAAIADAEAQAARNGLSLPFSTTPIHRVTGRFELVLANLFAETLVALTDDLVRVTAQHLVLAGILADREPAVRAAFDPLLTLTSRDLDGEWVCLVYRAGP
jgi:ribosomal protein L11 methyltransferase